MEKNLYGGKIYKYYSTQMPVDLLTHPDTLENPLITFVNYDADTRIPVAGETFEAWGEVVYKKPLTEKQLSHYYLEPSRENPDIKELIYQQIQVIGAWEAKYHMEEAKRLTCWTPDLGSYNLKYLMPLSEIAEGADDVRLYEKLVNSGVPVEKLPEITWKTDLYMVKQSGD